MFTWKDVKLSTLQKMFAADGTTIVIDESTKDYIAAMPYTANEGLQLLSTAGKFIIKSIQIAHNPVDNLLSDLVSLAITSVNGSYDIVASGARSYYFEITGKGTASIFVDGILTETLMIDNKAGFIQYKGLIENPDKKDVKITFASDYPMAIKNPAFYAVTFETVDEVQDFADKVKYDLKELASDFYMIDSIVYEGDQLSYIQTTDFFQEGNNTLVLDRKSSGNFIVHYKAYPAQITSSTTDDYVLPVDDEVVVILPLYMASQLYKDDDNGIATMYRNEFEVAFERLRNKSNAPVAEHFTSVSGW